MTKREAWYQYFQLFTIMFLCTNKLSLGYVPVQKVQFKRNIGVVRVMEAPVELIAFNILDALILMENTDGCICKTTC